MQESEKQVSEFGTFNEFFTRKLKVSARKINAAENAVVSPVDCEVCCLGKLEDNILIHVKGKYYTLEALLGDTETALEFKNGNYIIMYLHPRDYHRIHAPLSGKILDFNTYPARFFL
ncbi:Phosphatidylserine decarboxylase proenzyme [uncultured archaeon]|nr:Phosphatidylserine decarboxylase proenzyme [uncultured archaeon]